MATPSVAIATAQRTAAIQRNMVAFDFASAVGFQFAAGSAAPLLLFSATSGTPSTGARHAPGPFPLSLVDRVSYAGGMSSDSDDALTWDGDDGAAPADPALPRGWKAVGKGSAEVTEEASTADAGAQPHPSDDEPTGLSTAMLLLLGIVGGVYLLYAVGWAVGGLRLNPLANLIVDDSMFLPWYVLAIAAPAIWLLMTWVLTRGKAAWIRVSVLLLGAVLLVPWPFVTVGVIGS